MEKEGDINVCGQAGCAKKGHDPLCGNEQRLVVSLLWGQREELNKDADDVVGVADAGQVEARSFALLNILRF